MKTILFVHQSSELYGSDKTLLFLVTRFKKRGITPIVVLPDRGPLSNILEQNNIQIIETPVIKISRKMFAIGNLLNLPFQALSSLKTIDTALKGVQIDLVYSNTLAVLIGLLYAKKKGKKHIWHVHEIIQKPKIVKRVFSRLLRLNANDLTIFNSYATRDFWECIPTGKRSAVVWNGVSMGEDTTFLESGSKEALFGLNHQEVVIALIGRINKWKGQLLLLNAFKNLAVQHKNVSLVFVGSPPPGQNEYLLYLEEKINDFNLRERVKIIPFQSEIQRVWQSIDIAVIPSTEPEPFGLVALEAMLCAKPVIAADHGGLKEIVAHGETGLLFEPGNSLALEKALVTLLNDPEKRAEMGKKGLLRANTLFTVERYVSEIEKLCVNL